MARRGLMLTAATLAVMAGTPSAAQEAPSVTAAAATQPSARNEANQAVIVADPALAEGGVVVGTAGMDGLDVFSLAGERLLTVPAGEAVSVDVRHDVDLAGGNGTLLVTSDVATQTLRFWTIADGALTEVGAAGESLGYAVEGVCFARDPRDGALYVVGVGDGGEIDQRLVYADGEGGIATRPARRLALPSSLKFCVADDRTGDLYVAEEAVGLWRFPSDPEAEAIPELIDAVGLGRVTEELGGLALMDGGEGARHLIASDASSGQLFVYDREADHAFVGAVTPTGPQGEAIAEPGGLSAVGQALGGALSNGALVVTDEDAEGGANYKLIPVSTLLGAVDRPVGQPQPLTAAAPERMPAVTARIETAPVAGYGDAADDPAIWVNAANPAASLVIGTDKTGGLYLYDMQGQVVQHLTDGKMNNVDVRDGVSLGGEEIVLVAASNRTDKSIAMYRLDTEARRLVNIADGPQPTDQGDPYGMCLYQDAEGGTFVFINDSNGEKRQWRVVDAGNSRVRTERVRDFAFSSQVEGCVADDETGVLYVAEEDVGLWRLSAAPDGGMGMESVQAIADNPALKDDLEGVAIYDLGGGRGYIVVSSQGNDSYAVYRREGDQAYLGSFVVVADGPGGIDGISETDGLEVTSRNLGPGFEHGAMIAQDGRNLLPNARQNFKYVSWTDIARALDLEVRR
ncbi:phytase [Brevundimonas lutea]|uniref:phytase n=1 Tax=Brevundimonas lutea TaxID=2293980 RepID=UPI000F015791|nr:phytase [Brevundimonas lutea]